MLQLLYDCEYNTKAVGIKMLYTYCKWHPWTEVKLSWHTYQTGFITDFEEQNSLLISEVVQRIISFWNR